MTRETPRIEDVCGLLWMFVKWKGGWVRESELFLQARSIFQFHGRNHHLQ